MKLKPTVSDFYYQGVTLTSCLKFRNADTLTFVKTAYLPSIQQARYVPPDTQASIQDAILEI